MADGQPDIAAQLAQMQSALAFANSRSGKPIYIVAALLPGAGVDVNIKSTSIEGVSPLTKNLPTMVSSRPRFADKFLNAVQGMGEDFKKIKEGAQAVYAGNVTNGTSVTSNAPITESDGPTRST